MKNKVTTVYIAGPISNTTDYMERFANVQSMLEEQGFLVINPALVSSNLPKETPYESRIKMGFTMIDIADAIYMIENWEKSAGATREHSYAIATGKPIMYDENINTPDEN